MIEQGNILEAITIIENIRYKNVNDDFVWTKLTSIKKYLEKRRKEIIENYLTKS